MYKIHADKLEDFECKLKLEGASISKSTCRLVLESNEWNLLFNGEISSDGNVKIPIKKLKSILTEGTTGKLKLEVIADEDTFFVPWEDDFQLEIAKKVVVESINSKNQIITQPKISVKAEVVAQPESKKQEVKKTEKTNILESFGKYMFKNGINVSNLKQNQKQIPILLESYFKQEKPSKSDAKNLILNIGKCIEYLK